MPRPTSPLLQIPSHHEVLIIGAGATGIGIFRDLALHQIPTLLVDAKDFSSQTSAKSSKMLHGGIRYLETLDFALVREALHEKNLWLKLAPHLAIELPFHLPVYLESKYPFLWMTNLALKAYDFLSSYQNSPHKVLNAEETLRSLPGIKRDGLKGSGVYYDAIMDDVKIGLECLYDGLREANQYALNYVEVKKIDKITDGYNVELEDQLTGDRKTIVAKQVVVAAGPFTDQMLTRWGIPWKPQLLPTKGSHLWLRKDCLDTLHPLVLQCFDGRIIFVIPERNSILVGTTEEKAQGSFFDVTSSEQEIDYLLKNLADFFPTSKVSRKDILSSFSGIRPLVAEEGSNSHKVSRHHKIFRPYHNLFVIAGGKYTTFRIMGQEITSEIVHRAGATYNPSRTLNPLRSQCTFPTFSPFEISKEQIFECIAKEKVRTFSDLIHRRIGMPNHRHWPFPFSPQEFFGTMIDELSQVISVNQSEIDNF